MSTLKAIIARIAKAALAWATRDPIDDPVRDAVRSAFVSCGLPAHQFDDGFNLSQAGKMHDVYHKAASMLGQDPEWDTVGDVIDALKGDA